MVEHPPFFSIVIPTYCRPKQLSDCLESLGCLDYPRERFEVIVVDDGSEYSLDEVVEPFQTRLNLTLICQPNLGPAAARNTGAAKASGPYVAFTDDDCQPSQEWLQQLAARVAATPDCLIGGRTKNVLKENLYSTASQLLIDYLFSYYNAKSDRPRFFTSNNLAVPTEQFHRVGGFDVDFPRPGGEDRYFCDHWSHMGYGTIYAPEVLMFHTHELGLRSFWRQHYNYGRGAFQFHKLRAQYENGRVALEPPTFYLKMFVYPFSLKTRRHTWLLSTLISISQLANAAGYFRERMKST